MNPSCNITIMDMPLRIRGGIPTLCKSLEEDFSIETGTVVSEVGFPRVIKLKAYCDPFLAYDLRKPRKNKLPLFVFGKALLGEAFSAFIPRMYSVPAVGSSITIDPVITPGQKVLINMYNYIHADVYWIVHIPSPLGVGLYLSVRAGELDSTTVTPCVRIKPQDKTTVAFSCPWSNDVMMVPSAQPRVGQCGGSIIITLIEDNSLETVNTPIKFTAWCCVTNIALTGYNLSKTTGEPLKGLNFSPQVVPPPTDVTDYFQAAACEHADDGSGEVNAEGGVLASENKVDVDVVPLAPSVEEPVLSQKTMPGVSKNIKDTARLSVKWVDYVTWTLKEPKDLAWTSVTIDPYSDAVLRKRGENISLPWRRNVWHRGSVEAGYMQTIVLLLNVARPPQVSGLLEVKDSGNASSVYYVPFGSKVEIPVIPIRKDGLLTSQTKIRDYVNPWMRTDQAACRIHYRIISWNRTADIADVSVKMALRVGYSEFQGSRKPVKEAKTSLSHWLDTYSRVLASPQCYVIALQRVDAWIHATEKRAREEQARTDEERQRSVLQQRAQISAG